MTLPPAPSAVLVILDGWGLAPPGPGNAVALADTPVFDELWARYPHTQLTACGRAVGLPDGQMGNSEVGHLNLGAGAVVHQDLTRIDDAVARRRPRREPGAARGVGRRAARAPDRPRLRRRRALQPRAPRRADRASPRDLGVPDLVIHAFTDGRDTSPTGGEDFLATVEDWCTAAGNARIGTVIGRYFAMDRDKRWDRIQQAYDLLVHGRAEHHAPNAPAAARDAYERGGDRRVHHRDDGRRRGADPPRRQRDRVQLPPRPHARDQPRARRAGLRRGRPRRRAGRRALRVPDRVRGGLALPGRLPARAPEHHAAARDRRARRRASCTSPRRRSTRT